jgi:hypothetical protein
MTKTATVKNWMGSKLAATAAFVLGMTAAASAHASEPRGVDWLKVLTDLDQTVRGFDKAPAIKIATRAPTQSSDDPSPQNLGNAWFGVAPRVTLVARDWGNSMRLAGEQLSLVDQWRLSESTRMVVGRARWTGSQAKFTPFVQIGLGQWRPDRRYLPLTAYSGEDVATQIGGGFELKVSRRMQLAMETSVTSLIREQLNEAVPQTMLWSSFIASRIAF